MTIFLNLPNCSITSGGKTREAKALLKMAENSLSRPPIPILLKSQSGLMMEVKACLLKQLHVQQFIQETCVDICNKYNLNISQ